MNDTQEASTSRPPTPFALQAARASVIAPGLAVFIGLMSSSAVRDSSASLIIGLIGSLLIFGGLICAVIGLISIKKHGTKGLLVRSIFGLVINGFLIFAAASSFMAAKSFNERMKAGPTIEIPSSFVEFPEGKLQPNVLHSYVKGDILDEEPDVVFLIEDLGGTIGQDDDLSAFVDSQPHVSLIKETWKGRQIDVFRIEENVQDYTFITFNAQVPLLPTAYQVKLTGVLEREDELRADLKDILAGIDGPTNW